MIADLIVGGPYDLIVSNPPYVRESDWAGLAPEITLYEPQEAGRAAALDGGRRLVPGLGAVPPRLLGVEIGQGESRCRETLFGEGGATVDRKPSATWRDPARRHRPPLTPASGDFERVIAGRRHRRLPDRHGLRHRLPAR